MKIVGIGQIMLEIINLLTLQFHYDQLDLFKRKPKEITDTECKICHMKFSDPERTMRHMIKAHSKPQKNNRNIGSAKYR